MAYLVALLLTAAPSSKPDEYPLAAALVIGQEVVFVDVHAKTATAIPVSGITPEEADLDRKKEVIAFNGWRAGEKHSRIFLLRLSSKKVESIEPAGWQGDARFPRFSVAGDWLYFSAGLLDQAGGPENPSQVFRRRMSDGQIEKVETDEHLCHFSPVELDKHSVAYVESKCLGIATLAATDTKARNAKVLSGVRTVQAEVATSLDQKALFYTNPTQQGLGLFAIREGAKDPKLLTTISIDAIRIQPRFVCPKDVVFYNKGIVWLLDSKTGETTKLLTYPSAGDGGKP